MPSGFSRRRVSVHNVRGCGQRVNSIPSIRMWFCQPTGVNMLIGLRYVRCTVEWSAERLVRRSRRWVTYDLEIAKLVVSGWYGRHALDVYHLWQQLVCEKFARVSEAVNLQTIWRTMGCEYRGTSMQYIDDILSRIRS